MSEFIYSEIVTNEYIIYACRKFPNKMISIKNIRSSNHMETQEKCLMCKKEFEDNEYPYIAFMKNTENKLVCSECAEKIISEIGE